MFRVGGEEFAVLMPGVDAGGARAVAEALRTAVASTPFVLPLRVSVGLAAWPADAADGDALLTRADAALYAAKRAGKDRVVGAAEQAEVDPASVDERGTSLLDVLRTKDRDTLAHSARVASGPVSNNRPPFRPGSVIRVVYPCARQRATSASWAMRWSTVWRGTS